ncbi:hypothetical protein PMAA_073510 [Talaromyces marneffei ATCC 18224]|uniref:Uncharacterized protein n=1 Tax=Talaromyces marneffei (strain ATCC 18224 / CBS 334.59 / QM 7333) TaxID=441960 RepID=B6QAH9_TALMQ|nr:hypothetical protein PMAA_073510 [Talaromyces marneffei ATCC 18224]
MQIDYAMMGGAAICLLAPNPSRMTEDIDLVIHVDERGITADDLTTHLLKIIPRRVPPLKTFSPEWILREKILSQHQRQGNKADVDIRDAIQILFITTPGKPELDFDSDLSLAEALLTLIRKRPDQERSFEAENTMQCRFWELDDSTCTVVGPYILRVVI